MLGSSITGGLVGSRQASVLSTSTFPVNFNTTGIASAILVGTIIASTSEPVDVSVSIRIVTAFNAATTNILTVGTSTTATEWISSTGDNELVAGVYPAASQPKVLSFAGLNGTGAITLTGTVVGETVASVTRTNSTFGNAGALFESTISVANQIQQTSATDLSGGIYLAHITGASGTNTFRLTSTTSIYVKYTQTGTAATAGAAIVRVQAFAENSRPISIP